MCNCRYYDVISVAVSLLVGVFFAVLTFLGLLATGITIPIIALVLGFFALGTVAYGWARGMRCMNQAPWLVVAALALVAVAIFALVFVNPTLVVSLIIAFVIFTLITYVLFSLFCYLNCREKHGNEIHVGGCR